MAEPFEPITPTNLLGKSRLGGLSINNASGRAFLNQFITALVPGAPPALIEQYQENLIDAVLAEVPQGFLPKKQIRQILLSKRLTPFAQDALGLDYENFGNAITPNFADFAYGELSSKYLTSNSLHVYTRVPAKVAGVEFSLSNGRTVPGIEVTPDEFQADTIPYTFRFEETLAATNLPAWPGLDNAQLFSEVRIRYSTTGPMGDYLSDVMVATDTGNGVVWEKQLGIPPSGSVYYYFEVVLAEPLLFKTLDRDAIAALDPTTVTLADIFDETNQHAIRIDGWAMPDPRNLQLADRGIIDKLFTPDLTTEFTQILLSPQVASALGSVITGGELDISQVLKVATPQQLRKIQNILIRNTNALTTQFENEFDPMLASVFTVPNVDLETHSLWVARIPDIADGNYNLQAIVHDADGNPLDQIQENITVDTSAPEADIGISPSDANATGYWNAEEGIFFATAPTAGTAALLNIMGSAADIGPGRGYLFYQMIGLDADGNPNANIAPNTWMPLTVESTMLVSNIWEAVQEAAAEGRLDAPSDPILQAALALSLDAILGTDETPGLLTAGLLKQFADPFLKGLEPFTGFGGLDISQYQLIIDALGATVDIIDHLVPVTFSASDYVTMPIQGAGMPLLIGDYGIRAMGIDTLFNVGAYAAPTHLRIVDPSISVDRASIMNANIGDFNNDGMIHEVYETGIIYANTENVMITGAIENPTGHPIESIKIQYLAPSGEWQTIGDAVLTSASAFKFDWNVTDFDALISAGDTVMLRAEATNKLQLTDAEPMAFTIKLDTGVYPPEVLRLEVDAASITMRNPDSEGPQGTVTINAYTLSLTGPRTVAVRVEAKRESDPDWVPLGTATQSNTQGLVDAVETAVGVAAEGTSASINSGETTWSLAVDTTTLADTITAESLGARDVSKDDNRYTIRAFAVSADTTEWPSDATTMLSVDNVDDVEPLGPTNITAADGVVEVNPDGSYDIGGLIDAHDPSVVSPIAKFTIEPTAKRKTYASVKLVQTAADGTQTEIPAEVPAEVSGVEIIIDVGALGIAGNGAYTLYALAVDEFGNVQTDESPEITVHVKNYLRPDPAVFNITVDVGTEKNADSEGPQGTFMFTGYTIEQNSPPIMSIRLEAKRASDTDWTTIGTGDASTSVDIEDAALPGVLDYLTGIAVDGTEAGNRSVVAIDAIYHEWAVSVDTRALGLEDSITKDSPGARDVSLDDNPYTVRAFAVSADTTEWPSDATTMLSVDNVDDVEPIGPTNITAIANADGVVEVNPDGSYNIGGLIDAHDPSVVLPIAKFTIEPTAKRKTYKSVKLVTVPEINAEFIGDPVEITEGVFEITVDAGALGIAGNGAYTLHALAYDEFDNVQTDASPERTVHVKNYLRPDPAVFNITVDVGTEKNADSEGPQGTFMFTGYTIEQNSPPIMSIRLEAKRASDTDWTTIGTGDASTSVDIEDAALPGVLDYLTGIAVDGTEAGNRSVVAIDAIYHEWAVSVDTRALGLEDSITKDSPGARDVSLDDNPYTVRAFAVDGNGKEWASDATEMFSLDNVDDVAPLGPTNVSVTRVDATDNSVFEDAGDGSYTVGGLVDKHDDAVASPVATLTLEPTAARKTYDSVTLVPDTEGLVVTEVAETSVGSGVFTVTVDVGTLADGEYLENGIYMFHALAFDEFGNVQADMSETDGSRISVTVANTYRPAPQVLAFTVSDPTQTNPDSGAPQGTLALYGYSPEITSAPTTSVVFEVKRKNDTEWTKVGTASESSPVTAADDAKLAAANVADVADVVGGNVVKSDTYQRWMIEVDTTTLEDSITAESPGARDHTKDDNQYMVRATAIAEADGSANLTADDVTAMFSVDNVDDVAPLGPTNVSVTSVDAIDSVLEAAEDGSSYTVGGLVDKYDEAVPSPVATFTLKPTADRKTYKSVRFVPDIENLVVTEVTETGEGSGVFTVTVDVGTLADMKTYLENGTYMFYALAFDEFGNEQADDSETDGSKISVTVENSYRPAPEVLAIAVDPESITQTNPDSGAPQGTITLNSRSYEITSPPISGMRFEVKRKNDTEWIDVGTATESMFVDVSDAELADVVGNLASIAVDATEANESGEATVVPINRTYQEWMIEVDTTTLEDTITADSPAARDASKDDNQYMVRAVAIAEADGSETLSADGVTAMFSVDNVDDVPPVGPTNIVAVADVASMIEANEDGSYTVGGIVDDTVPTPIAIFTTEPAADPITYASVNLVQTTEDGTETITMGEAGVLDIMIDVGTLENGTYMFHALAVDEFGNVQTDESPQITVHVLNFRVSDVTDLAVIAVDGTDVPEPPAEPIPLRESVTVTFMVANGSLAAEELSGAVNGSAVPSEGAEDPENTFSLKVEVGALTDGVYTPDGVVTKRNGSVAFPLTTVNVDNTGPIVTIESPTEDETVDSLPTIRATYHDGAGSGVDGATGNLALARLQPPNEVEVVVDQAELEKDAANLVYTRREPIAGGAYRVTVQVTDNLGNVGEGSAEFAVNGTAPMVAIHSPAAGQTFEHGEPYISGEFSGTGTVEVTTFTINDVDATPEVEGNQFFYTPEEALTNDDYTVVVAVTDGDGNTARTSVAFVVDIPEPPKDTTPPVISTVAPSGLIKLATHGDVITLSAVVTDEQSDVTSVRFSINGGPSRSVSAAHIKAGEISISQLLEPGLHTAEVVATSRGGTTKHSWVFTLVFDDVKPTITSITPSGTIRGGLPVISASASDESGVDKMTITVMDSDGEEVEGNTEDDGEDGVEGITRLDFNPEVPLDEGTYTIEVRATDTIGNSATAKGNFTIDFDTAAPIITMASPQNNARLIYAEGEARRPTISISYADAETGINVESIRFVFNDELTNLTSEQKSASQVTYIPPKDLDPGQYSVKLEVFDRANEEGNVSDKSKGAREANMAVYEFTFSVEEKDGPIMAARPLNYPNPFKDSTRISFTLARQATVSIVIYDATLRPVRVLVDNGLFDAGNYTYDRDSGGSDALGWDGKSSSGEDLARGIYYCQIMVADGFEPEYAILKLALTR